MTVIVTVREGRRQSEQAQPGSVLEEVTVSVTVSTGEKGRDQAEIQCASDRYHQPSLLSADDQNISDSECRIP